MKHIILSALIIAIASCSTPKADNPRITDTLPPMWPDYADVTIPQQIAPLNFHVDSALALDVTLLGADGTEPAPRPQRNLHRFPDEEMARTACCQP